MLNWGAHRHQGKQMTIGQMGPPTGGNVIGHKPVQTESYAILVFHYSYLPVILLLDFKK